MFEQRLLNLLVAYPYLNADVQRMVKENEGAIRFVVDSGAFTAWKAGKPIALDDYCRFIESLPFKPWRYFTLDVIGDPHGTMKNYETMLARGFKPVPIFTRGEDPSVLDDYYKTSDVVGIGGLVGTQKNKGFVKGIMKLVAGRKVHLLGFTALPFIKHYRPYMCDCSSWSMGQRYARPAVYLGGGRMGHINKDAIIEKSVAQETKAAIARLGFHFEDFLNADNWQGGGSYSAKLGGSSYISLSMDIQAKLGTFFFLASGSTWEAKLLIEQYLRLRRIK